MTMVSRRLADRDWMKGFLSTYGNLSADLNLVIQIMMAVAPLAGACLAV